MFLEYWSTTSNYLNIYIEFFYSVWCLQQTHNIWKATFENCKLICHKSAQKLLAFVTLKSISPHTNTYTSEHKKVTWHRRKQIFCEYEQLCANKAQPYAALTAKMLLLPLLLPLVAPWLCAIVILLLLLLLCTKA